MAGLKRRGAAPEKSETIDIPNLVEGQEYEGRLVYVADLGLHERIFGKEVKSPCQKIALGIEIIGETVELDDKTVPRLLWVKPFNIFFQLTDKGKEIEYYKIFEPGAKADTVADWDEQLGKPVSVLISHHKKDDKCYDNIASLAGIPVKYQADIPPATIDPCIGDSDHAENECTKALYGLSKWMYEQRIDDNTAKKPSPVAAAFDPEDDLPF